MNTDRVIQIGNVYPDTPTFKNRTMGRVYDPVGISPTINTSGGGDREPKIAEPCIGAFRGRNPDNPSERGKSNGNYKQRLEMNTQGTSNTITSVAKDNMVVEPPLRIPQATKQGYAEVQQGGVFDGNYLDSKTRRGRVQDNGETSPTITTENQPMLYGKHYRIRKLTPRECFRLQGVRDSDIDKIQGWVDAKGKPISNAQQYKMAGNSITVDVLYYIFKNLFVEPAKSARQMSIFDVL